MSYHFMLRCAPWLTALIGPLTDNKAQGYKRSRDFPFHKLPKKSKLLWECSALGSQLPRKLMMVAINKHKLWESSWAQGPQDKPTATSPGDVVTGPYSLSSKSSFHDKWTLWPWHSRCLVVSLVWFATLTFNSILEVQTDFSQTHKRPTKIK